MPEQNRVGDLEINQDLQFQQVSWKIQRVSWIVMALILLSAAVGLMGAGPLSDAIAGEKDSMLWVEYNRFERYQSPAQLKVHSGLATAEDNEIRLSFNREFIASVELQHIDPEPRSIEVGGDNITYSFKATDTHKPVLIVYHLKPNSYWNVPAHIRLQNGPEVSFNQFFYP